MPVARILVIDDNEAFRASISDLLEGVGYYVATAADGEDGVKQFSDAPFDLVVCDLIMPRKDGLETISDVLKIAPTTPIISTTGYSDPRSPVDVKALQGSYLAAAQALGATHTLIKPFDPDEFLALVRQCLATGS